MLIPAAMNTENQTPAPDHSAAPPVSVMMPRPALQLSDIIPWAALIAARRPIDQRGDRAVGLWSGTAGSADPYAAFAFAAGRGFALPFGMAVALLPAAHPEEVAIRAATLSAGTGAGFRLGLGPGPVAYQQRLLGQPYARPVSASVDYLSAVRSKLVALQAGEVQLGLGVLRPPMARAAGRVADFAVTWMCPPEQLRTQVVPAVREGESARSDEGAPPDEAIRGCRVIAMVPVALRRPGVTRVEALAAACGTHLSAPHYRAAIRAAGIELGYPPLATDREVEALAATDLVVTELDDARRVIERYRAAGVDEVVLNPLGSINLYGEAGALDDTRALLDLLDG